jgi:hypothetical protein
MAYLGPMLQWDHWAHQSRAEMSPTDPNGYCAQVGSRGPKQLLGRAPNFLSLFVYLLPRKEFSAQLHDICVSIFFCVSRTLSSRQLIPGRNSLVDMVSNFAHISLNIADILKSANICVSFTCCQQPRTLLQKPLFEKSMVSPHQYEMCGVGWVNLGRLGGVGGGACGMLRCCVWCRVEILGVDCSHMFKTTTILLLLIQPTFPILPAWNTLLFQLSRGGEHISELRFTASLGGPGTHKSHKQACSIPTGHVSHICGCVPGGRKELLR